VYESNVYAASSTSSLLKAARHLKSTSTSLQVTCSPVKTIHHSQHRELQDSVLNAVVALTYETVRSGYGVLVFCSSRSGCESDARIISRVLPDAEELGDETVRKRADLLLDLKSLPSGLDPVLAETVPYGVAFHRKSDLVSCPLHITDGYRCMCKWWTFSSLERTNRDRRA
jgi:hypothetical protein